MGAVSTAVEQRDAAPARPTPRTVLRDLIDRNSEAIGLSLPKSMDRDRFARLLLTAANTNPALFDCDPNSFLAAGVACAQLGLEPNDARGLAYLIPFNDSRRGKVVNLILGYRGLIDLARRSGHVSTIQAYPVYKGETFRYEAGLRPLIEHVPDPDGDERPEDMQFVYAVATVDGDPQFVVLSRKAVDKVRDASLGKMSTSSAKYSPWTTHYVEMAKKTALRRLCKLLPLSVEAVRAVDNDERPLALGDLGYATPIEDDEKSEAIEASGAAALNERAETGHAEQPTLDQAAK
jgi:recombination protein RecT